MEDRYDFIYAALFILISGLAFYLFLTGGKILL